MAEIEEINGAVMDLQPEAWRYKTGSGHSVTEDMEYEVFTEEFQYLYRRIKEREEEYTKQLQNDFFLGETTLQAEEQRIRETLFTEAAKGNRRSSPDTRTSGMEIIIGTGLIVLLFFILVNVTVRRRKKRKQMETKAGTNYV